jgi:hypothetical protein
MEPIRSSETSAVSTQTPGKHPKENMFHLTHSESLKSRILHLCGEETTRHIRIFELKMEPIHCSETSAISTQTPGKHPKENIFHLTHGKSLKSRREIVVTIEGRIIRSLFSLKHKIE